MNVIQGVPSQKRFRPLRIAASTTATISRRFLSSGLGALLFWGCSSGGDAPPYIAAMDIKMSDLRNLEQAALRKSNACLKRDGFDFIQTAPISLSSGPNPAATKTERTQAGFGLTIIRYDSKTFSEFDLPPTPKDDGFSEARRRCNEEAFGLLGVFGKELVTLSPKYETFVTSLEQGGHMKQAENVYASCMANLGFPKLKSTSQTYSEARLLVEESTSRQEAITLEVQLAVADWDCESQVRSLRQAIIFEHSGDFEQANSGDLEKLMKSRQAVEEFLLPSP